MVRGFVAFGVGREQLLRDRVGRLLHYVREGFEVLQDLVGFLEGLADYGDYLVGGVGEDGVLLGDGERWNGLHIQQRQEILLEFVEIHGESVQDIERNSKCILNRFQIGLIEDNLFQIFFN